MTALFLEELDRAILKGTPESRERALLHANDLLMVGRYTDEDIWVFGEVIGRLAAEIELAARAKLAARLSRVDHAPGGPEQPLTWDDVVAKLHDCARRSARPLRDEQLTALVDAVAALRDGADAGVLAALVT